MKTKKNQFFIIFSLLTFVTVCQAQILKTYTGPFKIGFGIGETGKATYTYYDDKNTLERIKQGVFNYSVFSKNDIAGTFSKKVSGGFDHNLKNGLWQYSISYTDYSRPESEDRLINATGSITLIAPYYNGLPNGTWVYKKKISYRDKHYFLGQIVTSPYQLYEETNMSISFKNGVFSGPISVTNTNYSITGSFDSTGRLDGQWVVRSKDNEEITDYKNGLVIRRINRSLPNGEILDKEIDDPTVTRIKEDYLKGLISENDIKSIGYTIESRNIFKEKVIKPRENIFNDKDFMYSTLLGDLLMKPDDQGNFTINQIDYRGGNFMQLKKPNYLDLANDYNYKTAEEAFKQFDYGTAKNYYNTILKNQEIFPLKASDRNYVQKQIDLINSIVSDGKRIEQKSTVQLNSIFTSIFNSINQDSVSSLLFRNISYKPFNTGQINDNTVAVVYLPVCCIDSYKDSQYVNERLQVNFRNNNPNGILYWFQSDGQQFCNQFKQDLLNNGYKRSFSGWQNLHGDVVDITDDEFKAKNDMSKFDNYERIDILTNGIFNYRFCSIRVVLISKNP